MGMILIRGAKVKGVKRGRITLGNIPIGKRELEEVKERAAASGKPREVTVICKSGKMKTIVIYPDGRVTY